MDSGKLPIGMLGHSDELSIGISGHSDKRSTGTPEHSDKPDQEAPGHGNKLIQVEVAYARPDTQVLISVTVEVGATLEQAIHHSGVLQAFPEINLAVNKVGIFGKLGKRETLLRAGDRVEIYRPLQADPKELRRQRAMQGKKISGRVSPHSP